MAMDKRTVISNLKLAKDKIERIENYISSGKAEQLKTAEMIDEVAADLITLSKKTEKLGWG